MHILRAAGWWIALLAMVTVGASCSRPAPVATLTDSATAMPAAAAYPGRGAPAVPMATVSATVTPSAARPFVLRRAGPVALAPAVRPTGRPTPPITGTVAGLALPLADQMGGDVRLLGEDEDGRLLASIGARVHRFALSDREPLASSPLLPALPVDFARSGRTGVVATPFGLSVLNLADNELALEANVDLGPVTAVAMRGDRALALLSPALDAFGQSGSGPSTLAVVDVSRPTAPKVTSVGQVPGYAGDIAVYGDAAFVKVSGDGLWMLDLTDADKPAVVSRGPWPWTKAGQEPYLGEVTVDDNHLLVTKQYVKGGDRTCLFVFELSPDGSPSFVQSQTCPYGRVEWARAVGRTILLRRDERIDVFRIGEPTTRSSLDEIFGETQRLYYLAQTTAARVGDDVIFAPIKSAGAGGWLDTLRISVGDESGLFGSGGLNANTLWGMVRSVSQYQGVAVDGDRGVAVTSAVYGNDDPELQGLRMGENGTDGLLQRGRFGLEHRVDQLLLRDRTLYIVANDQVDVFSLEDDDSPFRHLGVLESRLPYCPDQYSMVQPEATDVPPGTPCSDYVSALGLHGPLLVAYRTRYSSEDSEPGPLVYDVSDPRRPELLGMVPGNQLVVTKTTAGRRLPAPVSVDYVNGLAMGEGLASAAVAWHANRAYLAFVEIRNCRGGCYDTFDGRLEVRDPRRGLDAAPIASLDLPESLDQQVKIEIGGTAYLLIARGGPTPGLYEVSLADPDVPRLVGFFPLAVVPSGLSTSGNRVFIADGEAGLIVLDAGAVVDQAATPTAASSGR